MFASKLEIALQTKGQRPPAPTRGIKKSASAADKESDEDDDEPEEAINFDDMVTRVDIRYAANCSS